MNIKRSTYVFHGNYSCFSYLYTDFLVKTAKRLRGKKWDNITVIKYYLLSKCTSDFMCKRLMMIYLRFGDLF